MTNAEAFKTAEERRKAFNEYCDTSNCITCPLNGGKDCKFEWLNLEAPSDIVFAVQCAISKEAIVATEKVLVDSGIDEDEASTVLQAIGYVLLDTELYPDE